MDLQSQCLWEVSEGIWKDKHHATLPLADPVNQLIFWVDPFFGSLRENHIFFFRSCVHGEKYAVLFLRSSHFSWKDDY